jgi:hypothetical protein
MSDPVPGSVVTALPSDHQVISAFGYELIIHLSGAQTEGRYAMWTSVQAPAAAAATFSSERG